MTTKDFPKFVFGKTAPISPLIDETKCVLTTGEVVFLSSCPPEKIKKINFFKKALKDGRVVDYTFFDSSLSNFIPNFDKEEFISSYPYIDNSKLVTDKGGVINHYDFKPNSGYYIDFSKVVLKTGQVIDCFNLAKSSLRK